MEQLTNKKTIKERLIEIRSLISVDLDSAKDILQSVILDNKNDFYLMEIECVANMIREEELYQELTPNQKIRYNCLNRIGKDFQKNGDYERAYYHYELAKEETNHPTFDYFLGKMLYKQRKYLDALPYFQEYLSYGGEKLSKCLLYMIKIYENHGQYKKANKLLSRLQKLEDTFDGDFHFCGFRSRNQNSVHDFVEKRTTRRIKVEVDEFLVEENLDIESYEDYNFCQKLMIIKDLMVQNQLRRAESYLSNLTPETKEEYKALEQFQKNKKLYRNKRR